MKVRNEGGEIVRVKVVGAPGWEDHEAELVMYLPRVDGVPMAVVKTKEIGIEVFEARYVEEVVE